MLASRLDSPAAANTTMPRTTTSTPANGSTNARHQVELYAHALKARLQLASFKALNGVGSSSLTQLDDTSGASAKPTDLQPLSVLTQQTPSASSTPALSQSESMPSSSQSSSTIKSNRSFYVDIFGTDFKKVPAPPAKQPRSSPSPSKRARPSTQAPSLLDQTADAPQLGSPQRRNGRFDWHNNPTPAMVAREEKLAAGAFALPTGSPSKRRREASSNTPLGPSGLSASAVNSPRRTRVQSNGTGFLPNGHPASSLAQDLGLTAPRTPRSRQSSARQAYIIPESGPSSSAAHEEELGQDQQERDRVANTLAVMAESRYDHPYTPPHSERKHDRKVSWSVADRPQPSQGQDDRAAADYLLYLASSPSPSPHLGASKRLRTVSGREGERDASGVLATPAHTSLWDPFGDERAAQRRASMTAPMTPPASSPLKPAPKPRTSVVGLGLDADSMSSSSPSPALSSSTPSPVLDGARAHARQPSANAEEYMALRTLRSPRTPPPVHSRGPSANGSVFRTGGQYICTPPGAPGVDTSFHYADFLNVSPSPQPPSTASFLSSAPPTAPQSYLAQRTPTKTNRYRFGA